MGSQDGGTRRLVSFARLDSRGRLSLLIDLWWMRSNTFGGCGVGRRGT